MTHDPKQSTAQPGAPDDAQKPDDLSEREWAEIQEARADLAAGRYYTHEEVRAWLREHQAARRRKTT
jgi:predicted transcriptional regulator